MTAKPGTLSAIRHCSTCRHFDRKAGQEALRALPEASQKLMRLRTLAQIAEGRTDVPEGPAWADLGRCLEQTDRNLLVPPKHVCPAHTFGVTHAISVFLTALRRKDSPK